MSSKTSIIFYTSWLDMMCSIPAEDAQEILKAIRAYHAGTEAEFTNPIIAAYFNSTIRTAMDANDVKYQEKTERVAKARKRRSEINMKSECNQTEINMKSECNQSEINSVSVSEYVSDSESESVSVSESVYDSVSESPTETDKRVNTTYSPSKNTAPACAMGESQFAAFERMAPEYHLPGVVEAKAREWLTYKSERLEAYTPSSVKALLEKLKTACNDYGDERVVNVITESMSSGYKGLSWTDLGRSTRASPANDTLRGVRDWAKEVPT